MGIYHRLDHLFRRLGYVKDDGEVEEDVDQDDVPLPFKPRAPKAYTSLQPILCWGPSVGRVDAAGHRYGVDPCADNIRLTWFSLHAGVAIKGEDRQGLKRLFRYTSRSSISPTSQLCGLR